MDDVGESGAGETPGKGRAAAAVAWCVGPGKDSAPGVFSPNEESVLGASGLHTRFGDESREIGYWIQVDDVNQGLATEVAGALTKVPSRSAKSCGLRSIVIPGTCAAPQCDASWALSTKRGSGSAPLTPRGSGAIRLSGHFCSMSMG